MNLKTHKKKPFFILVCSSTELSQIQGISAAGKDSEAQKLTPSLDAEFIATGKTISASSLPVSPEGIISPAIISKACLNLLDAEVKIINAGSFQAIKCLDKKQYFNMNLEPAKNFALEDSFSFSECENIFLNSINLLNKMGFDKKKHELIIAECVVGGTTTALGLLELLGYQALDLVSSSFKNNNKTIKDKVLKSFRQRTKAVDFNQLENPLYNCAIAGDKAQVVIASLCLSAMQNDTVSTLAGGTQMLAIYALIKKMTEGFFIEDLVKVCTSPWLVNDTNAQALELAKNIDVNLELEYLKDIDALEDLLTKEIAKFSVDQSCSYPSWQEIKSLYDQGYVKEGVGMGALLKTLSSYSIQELTP